MSRHRLPWMVTLLVIFFLYLPILYLVLYSFNASRFGGSWMGFTTKWYQALFSEVEVWYSFRNSLLIGLTATFLATTLGTISAYALHKYSNKLQIFHYGLIYTPLMIPEILMGISLLLFFLSVGFDLGFISIAIAHTTFCISYVAMVVLARLENFDEHIVEAAQDLGAGWWITARRIILPMLAPGIISGALLAFTMSLDDYIITSFVAGPGATTLPLKIFGMIKHGATPVINALSTLILTLTFILVFITQHLTKESLV